MKPIAPLVKQRGVALWMVLLTLIMAGGLTFYRSANLQFNKPQQQITLSSTMARAKEALIAYAVTDDKIPGRLPCPDANPVDGITDFFTTGICPSNVGWLPWLSLDLPEPLDESSTRLWYALAPGLGNTNQPINSDTATGLTVDGNTDIAALIIAPRASLANQTRPSNTPSDYLDGANGNGNDNIYVTGPQSDSFNDVVLVITRQELMAAVEKRVANEVNSCLAQHAASAANTDKRYPWPAPLTSTLFQGNTNTLFGRVPSTQPDAGLDAQLKASMAKLTEAEQEISKLKGELINEAETEKKVRLATLLQAAVNGQSQNIIGARNLFDAMYTTFNKTKQLADDARAKMLRIESEVTKAGTRISFNEAVPIIKWSDPDLTDSPLNSLITQLYQNGIDIFPWELKRLNANLNPSSNNASTLETDTKALQLLLNAAYTPRTDITPYLLQATSAANAAAEDSKTAALYFGDTAKLISAQTAAGTLKTTVGLLIGSVENSRINILASQVFDYAPPLESLYLALRNTPSSENTTALLTSLKNTKKSIETIKTGVANVVSAQNIAVNSINTVTSALQTNIISYTLIDSNITTTLNDIKTLASTIASNELIDNNVSNTSLNLAIANYKITRDSFANENIATPRLTNLSFAKSYGEPFNNATVNIDIWAKSISENAAAIAPQAKALPIAESKKITEAVALETSAYSAAGNSLSSITDKTGSAELLKTYIDTPNIDTQNKAIAALDKTTVLVADNLLAQAKILDNDLSTTTASAGPLVWLASRCDFLLPSQKTWWLENKWANTVFYQIGAPLMATAAKLTVNGSGSYRTVTIAAGKALTGQNHSTLTIANYLESDNTDPSRDNPALTPITRFISKPTSSTFNDRLAY